MSLTALQVLTETAAAEGMTWDATIAGGTSDVSAETKKFQIVTRVNDALRWWWKEYRRKFAWRETVDFDSSVDVTSGVIPFASLGEGSGCSLWTADPRPFGNVAQPIDCTMSEDGVHPQTTLTSVFAFYRTECPQITYAAESAYATPSDIPNACLKPVTLYANGWRLRSLGEFKQGDAQIAAAELFFDQRRADILNSGREHQGMVWLQNWFAME